METLAEECTENTVYMLAQSNPWAAVAMALVFGLTVVGIIWAMNR